MIAGRGDGSGLGSLSAMTVTVLQLDVCPKYPCLVDGAWSVDDALWLEAVQACSHEIDFVHAVVVSLHLLTLTLSLYLSIFVLLFSQ